jgi:hypothetical protein
MYYVIQRIKYYNIVAYLRYAGGTPPPPRRRVSVTHRDVTGKSSLHPYPPNNGDVAATASVTWHRYNCDVKRDNAVHTHAAGNRQQVTDNGIKSWRGSI